VYMSPDSIFTIQIFQRQSIEIVHIVQVQTKLILKLVTEN